MLNVSWKFLQLLPVKRLKVLAEKFRVDISDLGDKQKDKLVERVAKKLGVKIEKEVV